MRAAQSARKQTTLAQAQAQVRALGDELDSKKRGSMMEQDSKLRGATMEQDARQELLVRHLAPALGEAVRTGRCWSPAANPVLAQPRAALALAAALAPAAAPPLPSAQALPVIRHQIR